MISSEDSDSPAVTRTKEFASVYLAVLMGAWLYLGMQFTICFIVVLLCLFLSSKNSLQPVVLERHVSNLNSKFTICIN